MERSQRLVPTKNFYREMGHLQNFFIHTLLQKSRQALVFQVTQMSWNHSSYVYQSIVSLILYLRLKNWQGRGLLLFAAGKREKKRKLEKPALHLFYYGHLKPRFNHDKALLCVGKNMPVKLADSSLQYWFLNKQFHLSRQQSCSKQNYPLYVLFFKPHLNISTLRNNSL